MGRPWPPYLERLMESTGARRARAAIRLEIAPQDTRWGDTWAHHRNITEAHRLLGETHAAEREEQVGSPTLEEDSGRARLSAALRKAGQNPSGGSVYPVPGRPENLGGQERSLRRNTAVSPERNEPRWLKIPSYWPTPGKKED